MNTRPPINRRQFLRTASLATGGLVIGFNVPAAGKKRKIQEADAVLAPNAFLRIGTDDSVRVMLSHCEMGQGIWTALSMLIAEELDADWKTIQPEHAPAAVEYYHTMYGVQRTGGSSSLLSEFDRYRKAGATARHMLRQAAANRFQLDLNDCRTESGTVIAGNRKIRYGELAEAAALLPVPPEVTLKDPADWKIIGKSVKRLDTPDKITGKAIFGMDVQIEGMLTAVIARPGLLNVTVQSFNEAAAKAIPGVRQVVKIPQGIAVLADDYWSAKKGRDALQVKWNVDLPLPDSEALWKEFGRLANEGGIPATNTGNLEEAFQQAAHIVEAEYFQPFLAHAPMEPLNCTVRLSPEKCEIWTGTQTHTDDQRAASVITGLPVEKVFINTVFLGGSFGRRNITRSDFVREAVEIAKATGKVVKTVWTREDDLQGGFYRPAFLHRFKVGLDSKGIPIAWKQISVGQSVMTGGPFEKLAVINGVDMFSIEGMQTAPHVKAIPNQRIELNTPVWKIPVDNWRAVGLSHTIFAMESLADEMAHTAGQDPVGYRRLLYKDAPRILGVLNLAADKSQWGTYAGSSNKAQGIAVYEAVGSYVAIVVEVSALNDGSITIDRVICAVDCGLVINPDGVISQTEGSVAFGLSTALYSEITYRKGKVEQKNFYNYPMLRIRQMPKVETYIVPSSEKPGGIGESAVGQVMPALTNALFALTGKRIRNLPILKKEAGSSFLL